MSSRRKRAPPVRVDEQMKRRLDWNMLEDRRRDESEGLSICLSEPGEESSGPVCAGDAGDAGASGAGDAGDPGAAGDPRDAGAAGAELSVSPQSVAPEAWSALIGEIRLHPDLPIRPGDASISLQQTSGRLTVKTESISVPVDGSLGGLSLEDLDWLQKRKILQLSHESCDQSVKLKFFLLESGLGRPEFLSEGSGRLKKANQLLQKVMKVFYDFIIPEVMENGKVKKCDTELERQNVEELYEHVRHAHQREEPPPRAGLQHPDLRPLLRAYQRQAVDWMLRRENAPGSAPHAQPQLHFLWRELVTLCGRKLFYNPHTGCLIREFPEAGTPWPGGILADEMGLGKTVEVLALILCHTRQKLEHLAPALAAGQSVNYFVPPRPPDGHSSQTHPSRPKTRVTKAALRQMLLTAIAEVKMGKGVFIKDIFSHLRTAHQYDTLKNRHLVRKVLNKLMEDEIVEQVKGRGLAASFKLGKNYRERKRRRSRTTREAVEEPQKQADASPDCDQTIADAVETPEDPGSLEIPTSPSDHSSSVPDFHFQCICGEPGLLDHKPRVQCLSCLLWQHAHCVHFKPEDLETTPFYCPHCLVAMTPVSSRATLIISPSSICHQWVDEINRHVRTSTLRVMVYQGVKVHGFIQPHFLSEQDVVITTYDVLRSELNYVDVPHGNSEDGRQFRQQKRYMAVPSPLVAVEWWRVCLDEAQMVECTTAKAAEMALRLTSINRWCVSGTPVQRGLEDLYGLVLFLGVDPYWVKHWWDQLLYRPYRCGNTAPLYSFIAPLMWRSSKKHVLDQIQIPPQTEEVHWLSFSPVEKHFYLRQREVCSRDALLRLRKISDWSLKLSSLDRRTVTTALCPLLRLRQACCHPQAVRGEFLPLQKSTMTMEELLASLLKKCRVECEEAHRMLVCALNGLAGLHIIRGEFSEAAEMYREVLRSSEEQKSRLKTDSLQKLHATHNLMELLSAKHPGIPPTLRDHRLKDEVELLKQHYMSKVKSEVCEAHQNLQLVLQRIQELRRSVNLRSPWWLEVIQKALQFSVEDDLVTRVQSELTSGYKHDLSKLSLAHKFRDARGLQLVLSTQIDELLKAQKTVQEAVKSLEGPPSHQLIQEATVCHLRPLRLMLNNCGFCKADKLFKDYESKLFTHTEKSRLAAFKETRTEEEEEEDEEEERFTATSRVLFGSSETEQALKATLSFARARRLDPALLEEASAFLELLENWKKECKALSKYCTSLRDHVSAIDELDMAKERLRVRLPDEPGAKHIIEPHEVEQNRMALLSDRAVARSQLQKKLGQLLYLTNLEKSQDTSGEGANPEPCPICAGTLGPQWAVLTCGHGFCNECVSIMVEQYSVGSGRRAIRCAVCRQVSSHAEIFYVSTAHSSQHQQDVPVKGSHSTKVEAVVRVLLNIQRTEPGAKALVFSTWQDVLDIIAKALSDNSLEFTQINGIHQFQNNLSAFKHDEAMNILLLPLHIGSNGLNIIEATHVLLVEPILNAAQELQAIGRVHRIGQNKPTVVHRFLIRSTIEERMQAMLKTSDKSHSSASMKQCEACVFTVADLAELFTDLDSETQDAP